MYRFPVLIFQFGIYSFYIENVLSSYFCKPKKTLVISLCTFITIKESYKKLITNFSILKSRSKYFHEI